jgi:hypothetical protein
MLEEDIGYYEFINKISLLTILCDASDDNNTFCIQQITVVESLELWFG